MAVRISEECSTRESSCGVSTAEVREQSSCLLLLIRFGGSCSILSNLISIFFRKPAVFTK